MNVQEKNKINITEIYNTKGQDKKFWKGLLYEITVLNFNGIHNNIVTKLNQCLLENIDIDLTLSIIDFIIDYGNSNIIKLIVADYFLRNIKILLTNKSDVNKETRRLVLYLIQKWAIKYGNKDHYTEFNQLYGDLINKEIHFPQVNIKFQTYNKFISDEEIFDAKKIIIQGKFVTPPFLENNIQTIYMDPFSESSTNYNVNNTQFHTECQEAPPVDSQNNEYKQNNSNNNNNDNQNNSQDKPININNEMNTFDPGVTPTKMINKDMYLGNIDNNMSWGSIIQSMQKNESNDRENNNRIEDPIEYLENKKDNIKLNISVNKKDSKGIEKNKTLFNKTNVKDKNIKHKQDENNLNIFDKKRKEYNTPYAIKKKNKMKLKGSKNG